MPLSDDQPRVAAIELGATKCIAAIATLVLTVPPQRIVIGGGVGQGHPHLLPKVRAAAVVRLAGYGRGSNVAAIDALVVAPGLGADAGPLGAVALALDALAG